MKLIDNLVKELGTYPNYEEDEDLKFKFKNFLVLSSDFTYNENKENSLKKIDEIKNLTYKGVKMDIFC